jgi:hypothetical protein
MASSDSRRRHDPHPVVWNPERNPLRVSAIFPAVSARRAGTPVRWWTLKIHRKDQEISAFPTSRFRDGLWQFNDVFRTIYEGSLRICDPSTNLEWYSDKGRHGNGKQAHLDDHLRIGHSGYWPDGISSPRGPGPILRLGTLPGHGLGLVDGLHPLRTLGLGCQPGRTCGIVGVAVQRRPRHLGDLGFRRGRGTFAHRAHPFGTRIRPRRTGTPSRCIWWMSPRPGATPPGTAPSTTSPDCAGDSTPRFPWRKTGPWSSASGWMDASRAPRPRTPTGTGRPKGTLEHTQLALEAFRMGFTSRIMESVTLGLQASVRADVRLPEVHPLRELSGNTDPQLRYARIDLP